VYIGRTSFDICSGDLSIRAEMNTDEFSLKDHKILCSL